VLKRSVIIEVRSLISISLHD